MILEGRNIRAILRLLSLLRNLLVKIMMSFFQNTAGGVGATLSIGLFGRCYC